MFYQNITLTLGVIGDIMEHSFLVDYLIYVSDWVHSIAAVSLFLSFLVMMGILANNVLPDEDEDESERTIFSYRIPLIIAIISAILLVVVPTTETFEQGLSQNFRLRLNVE